MLAHRSLDGTWSLRGIGGGHGGEGNHYQRRVLT